MSNDEEELVVCKNELESITKELDSLAYGISHDLRVQIHNVKGFLDLLQKNSLYTLDSKCQFFLKNIIEVTDNMDSVVENLLKYSRISRSLINRTDIDLNFIIEEIKIELKLEIENRDVNFNIGELPIINCDRVLISNIFHQVISNSLKFSDKNKLLNINIGSEVNSDLQNVFYIADNGYGFDMKYADKAFDIFQKLHTIESIEGYGVGLAIVKRIVTRLGGDVYIESEIDKGTKVSIVLP